MKTKFLAICLFWLFIVPSVCLSQTPVISFYTLESSETLGPGVEMRLYSGGAIYYATQFRISEFGVTVEEDEPTTGTTTNPSGGEKPKPPGNGADPNEEWVGDKLGDGGYTVLNQPLGKADGTGTYTPLPTDTDYLPERPVLDSDGNPVLDDDGNPKTLPKGKYHPKRPDLRIEGELFDIYTPEAATDGRAIAGRVDEKARSQCDRVIIDLHNRPNDATLDTTITEIITEVNKKRNTPGTGIREDMEELLVVKPDGTIVRLFPGGGVN